MSLIYTQGRTYWRVDLFFENHLVIIAIKLFLLYWHNGSWRLSANISTGNHSITKVCFIKSHRLPSEFHLLKMDFHIILSNQRVSKESKKPLQVKY